MKITLPLVVLTCALGAHAQEPQRIISLIPAITEMLFALGVGDRVVAVSSFDTHPPEVEKLQRVGALLDPDLERILSLRPDLVAVYGSQSDLRKQLERAQVPMFAYSHAGLPDVTKTLLQLGDRVGQPERARSLAREIDARIAAVRQRVASRPRPRTLIVFGRERLALRAIYASGGYGFIHDMVAAAGGENVFADVQQEAVQATTELILARRPDVILELRADPLSDDELRNELATWRQLPSVPAVRNQRVHILTDPRTVIAGPRVAEGIEIIERALHPPRQGVSGKTAEHAEGAEQSGKKASAISARSAVNSRRPRENVTAEHAEGAGRSGKKASAMAARSAVNLGARAKTSPQSTPRAQSKQVKRHPRSRRALR